MGVRTLLVSDVSDERLSIARTLGADVTINPSTQNLRELVNAHTDGRGVDIAFEAVGITGTAQQTIEATRNKGTVIWIGNNQRTIEVDMQGIVTRELAILGSYGMNDQDFARALAMLADGRIPTDQLINRRADLASGPALFEELLASPTIIKALFTFPDG
jgi:threonine dehydrogenase-like Zn-dependent dehydrogenase